VGADCPFGRFLDVETQTRRVSEDPPDSDGVFDETLRRIADRPDLRCLRSSSSPTSG
jgi:hypothetical protein